MNDLLTDEMRRQLQMDQLEEAIAVIREIQTTVPLSPDAMELANDLKKHLYLQLEDLDRECFPKSALPPSRRHA